MWGLYKITYLVQEYADCMPKHKVKLNECLYNIMKVKGKGKGVPVL
jgi:hypothetical protein